MARPPSGQPRKERIALTVSPEIMQELRDMATKERRSISAIATELLAAALTCPDCSKPPH